MPDHYYANNPAAAHDEARVFFKYRGEQLAFTTDAGTFSRGRVDPGSELLLAAIAGETLSGPCADLGCGWGAIGLSLALTNPQAHFTMLDVNARAVDLARRNAADNGIANVDIRENDGMEGLGGAFCSIVTNPPIRAGKAVVYRFFEQAYARLAPGGTLTTVLRVKQGAKSAKTHLQGLFGNCETIARGGGYHVLRCVRR